jgi:hypothetical protein
MSASTVGSSFAGLSDASTKCNADASCKSFSYVPHSKAAYLKSVAYAADKAVTSPKVCFYSKGECPLVS